MRVCKYKTPIFLILTQISICVFFGIFTDYGKESNVNQRIVNMKNAKLVGG